jgi:hypothetical protein
MRSQWFAAVLLLTAAPTVTAQNPATNAASERQVTIQGCVMPGLNDTYVLTRVTEKAGPSGAVMPEIAHGRHVLFWLKNDADVKSHPNQMVEVTGRFGELKESEIELKAGAHKEGGLVVEFEGPGKDVKASNDAVGATVGTAGRQTPEQNDVKTYLAEVNVTGVQVVEGSCK